MLNSAMWPVYVSEHSVINSLLSQFMQIRENSWIRKFKIRTFSSLYLMLIIKKDNKSIINETKNINKLKDNYF